MLLLDEGRLEDADICKLLQLPEDLHLASQSVCCKLAGIQPENCVFPDDESPERIRDNLLSTFKGIMSEIS